MQERLEVQGRREQLARLVQELEHAGLVAQGILGAALVGDVTHAPHAPHVPPVDQLDARKPLEHPPVRELQDVVGLLPGRIDLADPGLERFGIAESSTRGLQDARVLARVEDLAGQAPHGDVHLVEVGDASVLVRDQDAVGRRFQRGAHPGQRVSQLAGLRFQRVLCPHQLFCGLLARQEDRVRVLQRDGAKLRRFVVAGGHGRRRASAASAVPCTRAWIFAKAVSRVVDVSSLNGAKPQSSVVPSCTRGM